MTAAAVWLKHRPLARAIARDYYLPGSEPQDVEQEALIGLWVAATTFDGTGTFKGWARIVITRRLDWCLRLATRKKHQPLNGSDRDMAVLPCLHQVSDRVEDRDQLRTVLDAIERDLTPFERHCVVGVASGLSYPEIDGNTKSVDNALTRARRKLRAAA